MDHPKAIVKLIEDDPIPLWSIINSKRSALKGNSFPKSAGVYCFWWIGTKKLLSEANRSVHFAGPKGTGNLTVKLEDWYPSGLKDRPRPLYVGKSTNLGNRIGQHLMLGTDKYKVKSGSLKSVNRPWTTVCQLRHGIEVIFRGRKDTKNLMLDNVGLTYVEIDNFVERFYLEDLAIGYLKPWFNLDSER